MDAILVAIGLSEGRTALGLQAATRMEALRVQNSHNEVDGAFGSADGSGVYSFDNLSALLAYQQLRGIAA